MFHGHAAVVRFRRPRAQCHPEHGNAIRFPMFHGRFVTGFARGMEMPFGTESAVTPGQNSWVVGAELRTKHAHLFLGSHSHSVTSAVLI